VAGWTQHESLNERWHVDESESLLEGGDGHAANGLLQVRYDQWPEFSGEFGHIFYNDPFSYYLLDGSIPREHKHYAA
jgi:hypothetical protein